MNQRALVGKAVAVGLGVVNETVEQAINATQRYLLASIFSDKHTLCILVIHSSQLILESKKAIIHYWP